MTLRRVVIWNEAQGTEVTFDLIDVTPREEADASRRDLWAAIHAESTKNARFQAAVDHLMAFRERVHASIGRVNP